MTLSYVIVIGRTGTGKSYLCNCISKTTLFPEGNSTTSVTQDIIAIEINGKFMIVDTPGFLDSHNNDPNHLAKLVDYIKNKPILAVLYVASERLNSLDRLILNELYQSDIKENLLVVFNKNNDDFVNSEIYPVIPISFFSQNDKNMNTYQNTLNEQLLPILTWIDNKQPISTNYFKQPVGLFKQPIQITHEDKEVKENIVSIEKQVMEKVTKYRKVRVSVKVGEKWQGWAGFGNKKDVFEDRDIDEPYETEELVTKKYLKYDKYHVKYALRFDDMAAVYAKEYLGSFEEPQKII